MASVRSMATAIVVIVLIVVVLLFIGLFMTTAGLDRIANPRLRTSV